MSLLSICIPTYNRAERVCSLVKNILICDSDDFCIEVFDNCSSDNTIELLNQINSKKLIVHKSDNNIGAIPNWMRALFSSKSKYAMIILDRDILNVEVLPRLINYLSENEIAFLKCNSSSERPNELYNSGLESLKKIAYLDHPSGRVYNVEILKKNLKQSDYSYIDDPWIYYDSFLACDLVMFGKGGIFGGKVWDYCQQNFKIKSKSNFGQNIESGIVKNNNNGKLERSWWHYKFTTNSMKSTLNKLLYNDPFLEKLTDDEKTELAFHIVNFYFYRLQNDKIVSTLMKDEYIHYDLIPRRVTFVEMLKGFNYFVKNVMTFPEDYIMKSVKLKMKKRIFIYIAKLIKQNMIVDFKALYKKK